MRPYIEVHPRSYRLVRTYTIRTRRDRTEQDCVP
nr:MAG TPA: hypothetical protein [Caudoviricetes sp.]